MILSFWYTYISAKKLANLSLLHVTVSFLASFFSLRCSLILLKCRSGNVQLFREIQLLCRLYNSVHQHHIIPGTVIIGVMIYTVCLYTLVISWSHLDLKTLLIFSNSLAIGTAIILACFHLACRINTESKQFLETWNTFKEIKGGSKRKLAILRRYTKSIQPLKIYFFESNFFERMTPVVILNFAMTAAINLILF